MGKELESANLRSETEHFKGLCKVADCDIGRGIYKAVISSIEGNHPLSIINLDFLQDIISIPLSQAASEFAITAVRVYEILEVTIEEALKATKEIAGLDGIPNKASLVVVR